jgi:hypothetical protein
MRVSKPAAVEILTNTKGLRHLRPFMRGEHTLTSAASELEVAASSLAYWVPKFHRAGLVKRVSTRHRAGAPMPVHRAVAQTFILPYAALPVEQRIALLDQGRARILRQFLDGLDEQLERAGETRLVISALPDAMSIVMDGDERLPSAVDTWQTLKLSAQDAVTLGAELEALIAKYEGGTGGATYLVHAGITRQPRRRMRSAPDAK